MSGLSIIPWHLQNLSALDPSYLDMVDRIVYKFQDHPSVVRIRAENTRAGKFSFSHITPLETYQVRMGLNHRKSTSGSLPIRILKMAAKAVCTPLNDCFNAALLDGIFPDELKSCSSIQKGR